MRGVGGVEVAEGVVGLDGCVVCGVGEDWFFVSGFMDWVLGWDGGLPWMWVARPV